MPHLQMLPWALEVQLIHHHWGKDHKGVWAGEWAREEAVGGPLPHLHGGEGLPGLKSACGGQEALGPVPTLCLRQRDRRFGTGENRWMRRCYGWALNMQTWIFFFSQRKSWASGKVTSLDPCSCVAGRGRGLPWGQGPRSATHSQSDFSRSFMWTQSSTVKWDIWARFCFRVPNSSRILWNLW